MNLKRLVHEFILLSFLSFLSFFLFLSLFFGLLRFAYPQNLAGCARLDAAAA